MFYTICGTKLRNTINSHKHEYLNLTSPQPIHTIFGHFKATGLNLESNLDHLFAIYPYFSYCGVTEWFLSFESGSGLSYLPKFVVYLECLETELQHNGYVYHLTLRWKLSSGDKVIVLTNWKILRSWKKYSDRWGFVMFWIVNSMIRLFSLTAAAKLCPCDITLHAVAF